MTPSPHRPMAWRGFTLIELLATVSLIAVLTMLILPLAGKFRLSAQGSRCAENLRQLHTATMMWSGDNGNAMPPQDTWMHKVAPYAGLSAEGWVSGSPSIFRCPSCFLKRPSTMAYDRTYSMNRYASGDYVENAYQASGQARITKPSQMALYMDGAVSSAGGGTYWEKVSKSNISPDASSPVSYVHDEGINVLFLDGHVQRIREEEMVKNYSTHASPFWRYDQ